MIEDVIHLSVKSRKSQTSRQKPGNRGQKNLEAFDDEILKGLNSPLTGPFTEKDAEKVVKQAEAWAKKYRMRTV